MKKFNAFTLAEVLITLGIIGVVAALTIPTLIMHHRKQVIETRLKKFYSMFNQAILLSTVDNGEISTWQYFQDDKYDEDGNAINQADKIDESFQKYLAPYMKIVSKKAVNDRYNNKDNKRIVYYLEDGSAFSYAFNENRDIQFYPENAEKCIEKEYAQRVGNCHFEFYFQPLRNNNSNKYNYNKNLEPNKYQWDGSENTLFTNCKQLGAYCTALIQHNGWKIPDNYPRKLK